MPIVDFDEFRDYLGVGASDPQVPAVQRLYDAIGAEILRITRRDFEGGETDYTEVIRLRGAQEFTVSHVPLESVTSIAKHNFDGTDEDPYAADRWRIEDVVTGRIRLLPTPEYIKVIYTTTGVIPAQVPLAYFEWGKAQWAVGTAEDPPPPWLASYKTGDDAESYFEGGASQQIAGQPPRDVLVTLLGIANLTGGGVV